MDAEVVCQNIEHTRFPTPDKEERVSEYPDLVRAADLIGQLADPDYLRKAPALLAEFQETGMAEVLGYHTADDVRRQYPKFYLTNVHPHVATALRYLAATHDGKQWLANLHAQLFMAQQDIHPGFV